MIIFFDIGATLIQGPKLTPAKRIAAHLGWDKAEYKRLDQKLLTKLIETPQELAWLAGISHSLAQEIWDEQIEAPEIIPGGPELLAELKAQGQEIGFISNIWYPYYQAFLRLYGQEWENNRKALSFRVGIAKPEPGLYLAALQGDKPEKAIMVGDSYDNDMAPALALGMRAIWLLHRQEKEQEFLQRVNSGEIPRPSYIFDDLKGIDHAAFAL